MAQFTKLHVRPAKTWISLHILADYVFFAIHNYEKTVSPWLLIERPANTDQAV